jgi:hypothetical protein
VLPRNSKIKIFAATLANDAIYSLRPARLLYDALPFSSTGISPVF